MINYKTELELSHLKNILIEREMKNEDEYYFISDFFFKINQVYDTYRTNCSELITPMTELYNAIEEKQLPFSESIIKSGILDFCIDRYSRSRQNADCGLIGLQIIECFVHSDYRYCEYIISQNSIGNFLDISRNSIKSIFSKFFPVEINILYYLVSNETTYHYFKNYNIHDIINSLKKVGELRTLDIVYNFISVILQLNDLSETTVIEILKLFIEIKKDNNFGPDYSSIHTIRWSQILYCLIMTNYFDIDLFYNSALFDFYEQNYNIPDHIPMLCAFYSSFIYKFPKQRMLLKFDFYDYFSQIMNNNNDNKDNNELKCCIYGTLSDFLYIFNLQQIDDEDKGIQSNFDFKSYIQQIPDNFIQNEFLYQISYDSTNGSWNIKRSSLCLLANFACVRPDAILKSMSAAEYINLFNDFLQANILESILNSIQSIYNAISTYQNSQEILHEITQTETYQNLCILAESPDCDKESILKIQNVISYFSKYQ